MKKFLFSLACVGLLVACGGDNSIPANHPHPDLVDVDHAHPDLMPVDHEHPDLVPAVHEHPDAEPVGTLEATGFYLIEAPLTVDTCADPSLADPDTPIPFGEWIVAAVQDTYLFMQADLILTSADGVNFSAANDEEDYFGCTYTTTIWTELSFTTEGLEGPIYLNSMTNTCPEYEVEESSCDRTWLMTGTKQ